MRMKYSAIMRSWGVLYPRRALSLCLLLMQRQTLTYCPPCPPPILPSTAFKLHKTEKVAANAETNKTAEESCKSPVDVLLATLADRYGPHVPARLIYTANFCSTSATFHLSRRGVPKEGDGKRWTARSTML